MVVEQNLEVSKFQQRIPFFSEIQKYENCQKQIFDEIFIQKYFVSIVFSVSKYICAFFFMLFLIVFKFELKHNQEQPSLATSIVRGQKPKTFIFNII